jgi:hypothetical protein
MVTYLHAVVRHLGRRHGMAQINIPIGVKDFTWAFHRIRLEAQS